MGVDRDHAPADRMIMIWDDGHWHEELTNDWLRKSAFKLHSEQMSVNGAVLPFMPKDKKYTCKVCKQEVSSNILHGHIDGIIQDATGRDFLFDHKAINHFTFMRWVELKEFPKDYFTQLAIYNDGIQTNLDADLKDILLLVKNKNTAQYLEFQCHYDKAKDTLYLTRLMVSEGGDHKLDFAYENIVGEAVQRFVDVHDHAKKKLLPKRQYYFDDWHCSYCDWCDKCWEGYDAEQSKEAKELPKTLPVKAKEGNMVELPTDQLLKDRKTGKVAEKLGETATNTIKNYMRLNDILIATFGDTIITRSLTKTGDRFSFREKKK